MNKKNITISGIVISIIYFVIVACLIMTQNKGVLMAMEIVTILSGVYFILLVQVFPHKKESVYKILTIVFTSCCMVLTAVADFCNLLVVQPLINKGVPVPEYFRIGVIPSFEMTVDYLGWGFFLGIAFVCAGLGMNNKKIKISVMVCGVLCLLGFEN